MGCLPQLLYPCGVWQRNLIPMIEWECCANSHHIGIGHVFSPMGTSGLDLYSHVDDENDILLP